MANGHGGSRRNSGRKPTWVRHAIILRESQPSRYAEMIADPAFTALDVMRENMIFYHRKAGELMAAILALPTLTHDEVTDAQMHALKDMAGLLRMRELAQQCARDLAPYVHSKADARRPEKGAPGAPRITHIPTPKAVIEAYERAAAGLPPEPRRKL